MAFYSFYKGYLLNKNTENIIYDSKVLRIFSKIADRARMTTVTHSIQHCTEVLDSALEQIKWNDKHIIWEERSESITIRLYVRQCLIVASRDQHPTQNFVWMLRLMMPLMQHISTVVFINHITHLPRENIEGPQPGPQISWESKEKRLTKRVKIRCGHPYTTTLWLRRGVRFKIPGCGKGCKLQLSVALREEPWTSLSACPEVGKEGRGGGLKAVRTTCVNSNIYFFPKEYCPYCPLSKGNFLR